VFFVIDVLAFVGPAVGPEEFAFSVHLVKLPFPVKPSAISPDVLTGSVNVVVLEVAIIPRAVRLLELPVPVLFPV
jgi:hypothetical protein